jgi:hypothetical protein
MEIKVNFIAILVAVVVNFILGFIWYTPLFGKAWGREMGYDPDMKPDKSLMLKGMLFMLIGNFLFAWVFAHNIAAWLIVPGMKEMGPLSNGLMAAIFTWLGFYFPGELSGTVWERHSWKLFWINTGYNLVSLVVVALILTCWT